MKFIDRVHTDWLTWTIVGTMAAFWVEDIAQMLRHGTTLSKLIGYLEGRSIWRHCAVSLALFVLIIHLAFVP